MSLAILCDACGNVCQGRQYFSVTGWLGKGKYHPSRRKKDAGWEIQQREDITGISADICHECVRIHLATIQLNPVKTRRTLMNELKAKNPHMNGLELLRRTAGEVATSITCDFCQGDCMEKYLAIKSGWLSQEPCS